MTMSEGIIKGGMFLLEPTEPDHIFTPEDMDGEQKLLSKVVDEFLQGEVEPLIEEMEADKGKVLGVLKKSAQLGIQGFDVPEKFGGMELNPTSSLIVTERVAQGGPFGVATLDHTAFVTLPILYFGTDEQKKKYLKPLATATKIGAFALTEPDSGSDALNCLTTATLSDDGNDYIISGEKQFISNAAYAGVFILFAKIDGEHFTAFILDGDSEGLSLGEEEDKMGIKGTSTRSVILDNVKIPRENLLFKAGKGQVVAFNTLNIGRCRMAGLCVGNAKDLLKLSIIYAKNRVQFGTRIADYGLIRKKIAEMALRIFAAESMLYRTSGLIDGAMNEFGGNSENSGSGIASIISEYAMECSMNKVYASEMLNFVAHEAVQIHGGYGYIKEYSIERYYRDSRINLIYGGTNEINRLLVTRRFLRKVTNGDIPLAAALDRVKGDQGVQSDPLTFQEEGMDSMTAIMEDAKKAAILSIGAAAHFCIDSMDGRQEIMGMISDILIEIFVMESALLRTIKIRRSGGDGQSEIPMTMCRIILREGLKRVHGWAELILANVLTEEELNEYISINRNLADPIPVDLVALRDTLAEEVIKSGRYFIC